MRACIGVYSPKDFWFNQGIDEEEEEEREERQRQARLIEASLQRDLGRKVEVRRDDRAERKPLDVQEPGSAVVVTEAPKLVRQPLARPGEL